MTALLGICPTNEVSDLTRFTSWKGQRPGLVNLFFDQRSPQHLAGWRWIVDRARGFYGAGASRILWSVPFPGKGQLEAVVFGTYDRLYSEMAQAIAAAVADAKDARARIRIGWEPNFGWQENAARAGNGDWNAGLYVKAFEHVAAIFQREIGRKKAFIVWCPNVGVYDCDPLSLVADPQFVDCYAQDFYLQKAYDSTGFFGYFRDRERGLNWGRELATSFGRSYALSEWGMDDDRFVPDLAAAAAWIKENDLHHHCWWDRNDGPIGCAISDGSRTKLAAAYKEAFA